MTADEYMPDEEQVRAWCREGAGDYPDVMDEWLDRFLARVRRDAAREQFENFIANMQTMHDGTHLHAAQIVYAEVIRMAEVYAKANFPEETP